MGGEGGEIQFGKCSVIVGVGGAQDDLDGPLLGSSCWHIEVKWVLRASAAFPEVKCLVHGNEPYFVEPLTWL